MKGMKLIEIGRFIQIGVLTLGLLALTPGAWAADEHDLAKASQNPVASLISVPFEINSNFNGGPKDAYTNVLNVRPVYPTNLGYWNLIKQGEKTQRDTKLRTNRKGGYDMNKSALALCLITLLAACTPISQQAKQELKKPVNCATAEGDMRVLKQEKASNTQRIASGVTSVVPAGLILGLVTGTAGDKAKVATGEYNKMIDAKIAEIKRTCGL